MGMFPNLQADRVTLRAHCCAQVSDFVDDLQLKEQALSLASAESVFARVGRVRSMHATDVMNADNPTVTHICCLQLLGSSVDSVSNQSLLLPGRQ
jgi:hypothetical protein